MVNQKLKITKNINFKMFVLLQIETKNNQVQFLELKSHI